MMEGTPRMVRLSAWIAGFMLFLAIIPLVGMVCGTNLFPFAWAFCLINWYVMTPIVGILSVISLVIIVRSSRTLISFGCFGTALVLAAVSDYGLFLMVNFLAR